MYKFYLLLMTSCLLQASEISSLLVNLQEKEALYHKTKVESAGVLTLYTRADLDKMQAYRLKDILKSLRYFTYKENYVGQSALAPVGATSVVSSMFRLYIDNHEVSSAIYGSSMLEFGNMDLGFVDHIEIYQGGNAIAFGNEPGRVTIRLYSKDPKRENGTALSLLIDNRSSDTERVCYTKNFQKRGTSLLAYASHTNQNREKVTANTQSYSKDTKQNAFYLKYNFTDKNILSAGYFQRKNDAFIGVGMRQTPISPNNIRQEHFFINLHLQFLNDIIFESSVDAMQHNLLLSDKNKIRIVQSQTPFTYFDGKFHENIYKAALHQTISHLSKRGVFKWGVQGIHKSYAIDHMLMDGSDFSQISGPSKLDILSVYAEESLNFDPQNLFIATLKLDRYSDNDQIKGEVEKLARVGYIHLFSRELSSKLFYSENYLYPGFAYTSTFPNVFFSNPKLGAEHYRAINSEATYEGKQDKVSVNFNYLEARDAISYDGVTRKFINSDKKARKATYSLEYTHHFNRLHKISAQIYAAHFFDDVVVKSPTKGGYLRSFDTFGRFDLFNELIYRNAYTYPYPASIGGPVKIAKGFDYTLGVQYNMNHALTFSIKGENLLNKASQTPVYLLGGTNAIERRVIAKMEYFF